MKKIRIGIFTKWFWPLVGGTAIHAYELVRWLAEKGHEVHLFIRPEEYSLLKRKDRLRLPCAIHPLEYPGRDNFLKGNYADEWKFNVDVAFRNARRIKNLNLDILHGHTPSISYITVVVGKMIDIPTVLTLHFSIRQGISISNKCLSRCLYMNVDRCLRCKEVDNASVWNIGLKKIFLQNADRILVTSERVKHDLIKYYRFSDNLCCVPNWVDVQRFKPRENDTILLQRLKIGKNTKVITYCGHIFERKGIEYLIRALPTILSSIKDATLLIAGQINKEDPFFLKMRELIRKLRLEGNVVLLGRVNYEDMPRVYSITDLLILPSLEENQPLVLLEAMAAKVPIVATSLEGIKDIIRNGENGILVEKGNPGALAAAAIKILSSNSTRLRLIRSSYRTVKEKFLKEKVLPKILKIYEREILSYTAKR